MKKRTTELMALDSIKRATSNPKRHDVRAIMRSMALNGFGEAPMLDERTGRLIAGHGRLEALTAMRLEKKEPPRGVEEKGGEWLVPIQRGWESKNDAEAKAYLVASNRTTELGGWDDSELNEMLSDIAKDGADALAAAGYDGAELEKMLSDANPTEPDEAPPAPAKSWVETGDLFQLGDHRLLCGDSTKREDYERLFDGKVADLLWTDPPYGVSYSEKNAFLNAVAPASRIQTPIENDSKTTPEMGEFWLKVFTLCFEFCKSGAAYYVTGPQGGDLSMMMMMMMQKSGWLLKHVLIWAKNNHVLGRCDYHYKHEPILYGWKPGAGHYWAGGHSETSLWDIDKPHKSELHPTMKPIELYEKGIINSSRRGDVVFDPFSGSGTNIIACEKTGRKSYAIEMSEAYVQVGIERWEKFTGKKHVKL